MSRSVGVCYPVYSNPIGFVKQGKGFLSGTPKGYPALKLPLCAHARLQLI